MIVSTGLDIYIDRNENLARAGPSQPTTSWPVTIRHHRARQLAQELRQIAF